jgi:protein gp37
MVENSKIEWTDHTFNPWVGCTKISPACDHCYAEGWAKRTGNGALWQGARRRTSLANWRQPLKWDRDAEREGVRRKVFAASLADVFDNQAEPEWRRDLFDLVSMTPNLDWLLLTKRPQNIAKMIERDCTMGRLPENVWLGTTVENQDEAAKRISFLRAIPATVRFLSYEPALGPLAPDLDGIHWVIAGGESGHGARIPNIEWFRALRDQCTSNGVSFFFKQWGEWAPGDGDTTYGQQYYNVGKKAAGALLDGKQWREMPTLCRAVEMEGEG